MPKPRSINCDTRSTAGFANRSVKIEEPRRYYRRSKTGSRQPLAARGLFALAPFFQIRAMCAVSQHYSVRFLFRRSYRRGLELLRNFLVRSFEHCKLRVYV
jgi:hypothetical protein